MTFVRFILTKGRWSKRCGSGKGDVFRRILTHKKHMKLANNEHFLIFILNSVLLESLCLHFNDSFDR